MFLGRKVTSEESADKALRQLEERNERKRKEIVEAKPDMQLQEFNTAKERRQRERELISFPHRISTMARIKNCWS